MEYEIISLDVWGNDNDGYEVNAAYRTNQFIEITDINNDKAILNQLVDDGYIFDNRDGVINEADGFEVSNHSDNEIMYINDKDTGRPIINIELVTD